MIDTRLVVNSLWRRHGLAHENNVIGTMNILAACTGADSPVRKFIFKSSTHYYGSEQDDPAFFTERMRRPHPPHSALERDIVEAEQAVNEFAERNRDVTMTVLRCANVLGPDVDTAFTRMFRLPLVPMVLGFDPRLQYVHEDDVVHALEHAAFHVTPGIYNVAADGVLALSEIIGLLGKRPCRSCRPGARAWSPGRFAGWASGSPTRSSTSFASGGESTTGCSRPPVSASATRLARPCSIWASTFGSPR